MTLHHMQRKGMVRNSEVCVFCYLMYPMVVIYAKIFWVVMCIVWMFGTVHWGASLENCRGVALESSDCDMLARGPTSDSDPCGPWRAVPIIPLFQSSPMTSKACSFECAQAFHFLLTAHFITVQNQLPQCWKKDKESSMNSEYFPDLSVRTKPYEISRIEQ